MCRNSRVRRVKEKLYFYMTCVRKNRRGRSCGRLHSGCQASGGQNAPLASHLGAQMGAEMGTKVHEKKGAFCRHFLALFVSTFWLSVRGFLWSWGQEASSEVSSLFVFVCFYAWVDDPPKIPEAVFL